MLVLGGKSIHQMVKDTNKALRVSNTSNDWRGYIDFVNNIVVDGLAKVVYTSLGIHQSIYVTIRLYVSFCRLFIRSNRSRNHST